MGLQCSRLEVTDTIYIQQCRLRPRLLRSSECSVVRGGTVFREVPIRLLFHIIAAGYSGIKKVPDGFLNSSLEIRFPSLTLQNHIQPHIKANLMRQRQCQRQRQC